MARNLLFITTDQQRFDSLPCYGADFAITPNLDRLAGEGVVFDRCYVPAPVCVPTRASLMTGRFPSAHGAVDNFGWIENGAAKWTEAAREADCRTAAIGKMHFAPWDIMEGFDERVTCEDKRHFYIPDDHAAFMQEHGVTRPHPKDVPGYFETCGAPDFPFDSRLYPDVFIADQAVNWIGRHDDSPFALWVSFVGPHDPYDPPSEYSSLYDDVPIPKPIPPPSDPEAAPSYRAQPGAQPGINNSVFRLDYTTATPEQISRWRRNYFGNITLIDEGIGRVLTALEQKGLADDTVVIFTSDHGDALGDHGMVFKGFFYESMVHVPLIVRDGVNSGRRNQLVGTTDVVAYFHDVLGLAPPENVQGSSLAPVLADDEHELNESVFSEMRGRVMVFDGRHKYVHAADGGHELYDLEEDPDELRNIVSSSAQAPRISDFREALLRHQMESTSLHGMSRRTVAYEGRLEMEEEYRRERRGSLLPESAEDQGGRSQGN